MWKKEKAHEDVVTDVSFTLKEKYIVSVSFDKYARVWDLQGKMKVEFGGHFLGASSLSCSPVSENAFVTGDGGHIRVFDIEKEKEEKVVQAHIGYVNALSYSPCGQMIASGGYDEKIKVWTSLSFSLLHELGKHTRWVHSLCFSSKGDRLVSGSTDKIVKLWDVVKGELVRSFEGHEEEGNAVILLCNNDKTIISGSDDKTIKEFDVSSGKCTKTWKNHSDAVEGLSKNRKETIVVSGIFFLPPISILRFPLFSYTIFSSFSFFCALSCLL